LNRMVSTTIWSLLCLTFITMCDGRNVTEATNKEPLGEAVANLTQVLTNLQKNFQNYLMPFYKEIGLAQTAARQKDTTRTVTSLSNMTDFLVTIISELEKPVGPDSSLSTEKYRSKDLEMALDDMKKSIAAVESNHSCTTAGVDGSPDSNKNLTHSLMNVRQTLNLAFSKLKEDVDKASSEALFNYVSPETIRNIRIQFEEIILVLRNNGSDTKSSADSSTNNRTEDHTENWKQALMDVPKAVEAVINVSNNLCVENKTVTDTVNNTDTNIDPKPNDNETNTNKTGPHKLEVPGFIAAYNFSSPTKTKILTNIDNAVLSFDLNRDGKIGLDEVSATEWNGSRFLNQFSSGIRDPIWNNFLEADKNGDLTLTWEEFVTLTEGSPLTDANRRTAFNFLNTIRHSNRPADESDGRVSWHQLSRAPIWYAAAKV